MIHLQTLGLSVLGAITFGIFHDFITANICVEYFTIGHPKIIESQDPNTLALLWGVIATWWFGLILGILIISYNSFGKSPSLPFSQIKKYVLRLLLIVPCISLVAGIIGFTLSYFEVIHLIPKLAVVVPEQKHNLYLAVGWAHTSSYLTGLIGTIIICWKIHSLRRISKQQFKQQ